MYTYANMLEIDAYRRQELLREAEHRRLVNELIRDGRAYRVTLWQRVKELRIVPLTVGRRQVQARLSSPLASP
jgi:hypothetical protein